MNTPANKQALQFWGHFEDLVEAYVGPFTTKDEVDAHAKFCADRGDGATYHGAVNELPADAIVFTPDEDKEENF